MLWDLSEEEKKQRKEWVEGLKVGDLVAIPSRHGDGCPAIAKVSSVTRTIVRIPDKYRQGHEIEYRREDGRERGRGYGGTDIVPVTPEIREQIRRERVLGKLKQLLDGLAEDRWKALTTERAEQVLALLSEPPKTDTEA